MPLRSVFKAASLRLGILRKYCRVFYDRSLFGRCFWGFVLPVLEYCSAVWCSAADTHLKLLNRAVSVARFLLGVCLNVTLLIVDLFQSFVCCITSGITRCTLLMVIYLYRMCQCGFHAVLWFHVRRYTYASPRSRTSQYCMIFIPLLVSLCNDLPVSIFDGCGTGGFQSMANAFLLA